MIRILVVIASLFNSGNQEVLRSNLGTKTPYAYVQNSDVDNLRLEPGCKPHKLWMLVRHGTRYPKAKGIVYIKDKVRELSQNIAKNFNQDSTSVNLTESDLKALLDWHPLPSDVEEKHLHPEGELEMILLAERTQQRFDLSQGILD